MATSSAFSDVNRVRELAEQIRARCAHAHQLKLTGQQTGSLQVAQAEEIHKRLNEAVFRLQEAVRGTHVSDHYTLTDRKTVAIIKRPWALA